MEAGFNRTTITCNINTLYHTLEIEKSNIEVNAQNVATV